MVDSNEACQLVHERTQTDATMFAYDSSIESYFLRSGFNIKETGAI